MPEQDDLAALMESVNRTLKAVAYGCFPVTIYTVPAYGPALCDQVIPARGQE